MESAKLHTETVHIGQERALLLRQGLTPEAAREALEAKFRIFSREKGAFTCACCGQRVVMVLYADSAIFRHYDSEACAGERNFSAYSAGLEKAAEQRRKHAEGKETVRRMLQVMQSAGEYRFEDGYLHQKELRFVPDFLITLADGERWAVDYVVSLRGDAAYRRRLRSRLMTYSANGFKPLFLIDRSWLSVTGSAYITFNRSELDMRTPPNPYDAMWKQALSAPPLSMTEPVYSLVYLDVPEELAILARFQMSGDRFGRLLFEPTEIPLDHLLSVDAELTAASGLTMLRLFKRGERATIAPYCRRLMEQLLEEERERAAEAKREEALRERLRLLREESLPAAGAAPARLDPRTAAGRRPSAASGGELEELTDLLLRCRKSPRLAEYPALEEHLTRAAALIEAASAGLEGSAGSYRSAWSILRNVSYPLLGE